MPVRHSDHLNSPCISANVPNDDNAINFIETAQTVALEQHVKLPIHTSGNMLDLVLTELFYCLKYSNVVRMNLSHITVFKM